jgi:hypothetical protein
VNVRSQVRALQRRVPRSTSAPGARSSRHRTIARPH